MSDKMISRVPLCRIVVHRDGKPVRAKSGVAFNFTQAEIDELERNSKANGKSYLREPVNEAPKGIDPKVVTKLNKLIAKAGELAVAADKETKVEAKAAKQEKAEAAKAEAVQYATEHELADALPEAWMPGGSEL